MSGEKIGCSGYLIKAPPIRNANDSTLAKWHRRFFIIREGSSSLEYWEDESLRVKKGEVDLKSCSRVRPSVISKRFPHLFSMVLPDREWFFAADNEDEKKKWVDFLTSWCGDRIIRSQTVSVLPEAYAMPSPAGELVSAPSFNINGSRASMDIKNGPTPSNTLFMAQTEDSKSVWLRIAYPNLEMLDVASQERVKVWPLSHMRGYGQEKNCFSFDIGKRFPGAGHYEFHLQMGDDIFSRLDKVIAENAPKTPLEPLTPVEPRTMKQLASSSSLPASAYSTVSFEPRSPTSPDHRPRATSESPYTYVQTQTYVEVGSFTPQKPMAIVVDESSSYAQVDIMRTQALGKALQKSAESPSSHPTTARKTRHDGIALPAPVAAPVEQPEIRSEPARPRQMSTTDQQEDIDDLLNSLDVQDNSSPGHGQNGHALYENTKPKHSYVNLPNPAATST